MLNSIQYLQKTMPTLIKILHFRHPEVVDKTRHFYPRLPGAQNGGSVSRLQFAKESVMQQKTNLEAANGRIMDVDIAEESTRLAKYNILVQASAAMLSQANVTPNAALMLLG